MNFLSYNAATQASTGVMDVLKAEEEAVKFSAAQSLEAGMKVRSKPASQDLKVLMHLNMEVEMAKVEFADVRFIIVGGTEERMKKIADVLGEKLEKQVRELSKGRFVVYKVGTVMLANHGMGCPSISICINELVLGLQLAQNTGDVRMFRIGTTGGIGVEAGGVVVTSEAVNENLEPAYEVNYMGKKLSYPTVLDREMVEELSQFENVVLGKTMTAQCFYDNQGRVDGPFAEHTKADKMEYLNHLHSEGVRNIEMEGTCFSALARRAGIRAAIVCMVLVNRLEAEYPDEASLPNNRAIDVVCEYICKHHETAAQ